MEKPLHIFCCSAPKISHFLFQLGNHLKSLARDELIIVPVVEIMALIGFKSQSTFYKYVVSAEK